MKKKISIGIALLSAVLLTYGACIIFWRYIRSTAEFKFFPIVRDFDKLAIWVLVVVQLTIAILLLFRKTTLFGLYANFFLLTTLSGYLYVILHYADHIPCACMGIIPMLSWEGHLWFTISFASLTAINIVLSPAKDIHTHE